MPSTPFTPNDPADKTKANTTGIDPEAPQFSQPAITDRTRPSSFDAVKAKTRPRQVTPLGKAGQPLPAAPSLGGGSMKPTKGMSDAEYLDHPPAAHPGGFHPIKALKSFGRLFTGGSKPKAAAPAAKDEASTTAGKAPGFTAPDTPSIPKPPTPAAAAPAKPAAPTKYGADFPAGWTPPMARPGGNDEAAPLKTTAPKQQLKQRITSTPKRRGGSTIAASAKPTTPAKPAFSATVRKFDRTEPTPKASPTPAAVSAPTPAASTYTDYLHSTQTPQRPGVSGPMGQTSNPGRFSPTKKSF